ncbi:ankyrin repeat protein [Leptospira noguchii str. Cascata]|nr:ankyrin repeat protein [Leptospira noguchii str. Cascata]
MVAVENGNESMVKYLLEKGAQIDLTSGKSDYSKSALMMGRSYRNCKTSFGTGSKRKFRR